LGGFDRKDNYMVIDIENVLVSQVYMDLEADECSSESFADKFIIIQD